MRLNKRLVSQFVLPLCLMSAGCAGVPHLFGAASQPKLTTTAAKPPAALFDIPSVPFRTLYYSAVRPEESQQLWPKDELAVIRSQGELDAFFVRNPHVLYAGDSPPIGIDFSQKQLVAIALGPQPLSNTFVEIASVEDRPHNLMVHAIVWEPEVYWEGGGCPYQLVEMARTDKPVSFGPLIRSYSSQRPCRRWPELRPGVGNYLDVTCNPTDGDRTHARFGGPRDVTVNQRGEVFVSDESIRQVFADGSVKTIAAVPGESHNRSIDIVCDDAGNLFVAPQFLYGIYRLAPGGSAEHLAGGRQGSQDGRGPQAEFADPYGLAIGEAGNLYVIDGDAIRRVSPSGEVTTAFPEGGRKRREGIAADRAGNVYVGEGNRIIKFTAGGKMTVFAEGERHVAPSGLSKPNRFETVTDLAVDDAGVVYASDTTHHCIWAIQQDGSMRVLAGSTAGYADGVGAEAKFDQPLGIAVSGTGVVYVADWRNHRVRQVMPDGRVSTLAGNVDGE